MAETHVVNDNTLRCKRYCFTDNTNGLPTWDASTMGYLVFQTEKGNETGHIHTQGYVRFKERIRALAAKKALGLNGCHLTPARGTEAENRAYCTKEDTRVPDGVHGEYGEYDSKEGQGKRSDLEDAVKIITQGGSISDVAAQFPKTFVISSLGLERLATAIQVPPPKQRDILVTVLWGATGTGKTHRTHERFPELYVVHGHPRNPWDQYNGQLSVMLDEFNPSDWQITDLNAVLDKWPMTLSCRYNNKKAYWVDVVIAANTDPWTWYTDTVPPVSGDLIASLRRRLSHVVEVSAKEQDVLFAREAREAGQLQGMS